MKKSFIVLISVVFLASCGGNNKQKEATVEDVVATTEEVTTTSTNDAGLPDEHNALNSLDYEGSYAGLLPTASGEGMKVKVTLSDKDFTKEVEYVGKSMKPIKEKGTYIWDTTGNIITLEGIDTPNQYFVGENTLTQLDIEGNKITGDLANPYILKKQ